MLNRTYAEYATEKAVALLAIDSPTGYTKAAAEWVKAEFAALGYPAEITVKGGVLIDLGGEDSPEGGLLLAAHADTLGGMVAEIKGNGRLRLTNLGGMKADNGETENVRVHTRDGKVKAEMTFTLSRTNDVNKVLQSFKYTVLEDISYSRLAFYQAGADLETVPPLTSFTKEDVEPSIVKERGAE